MSETASAADNAAEEATMPEKKTAAEPAKTTRTVRPAKPAAEAKPAKARKPKREKALKEPQPTRVFAIRITDEKLAAIHKAAGPRNATRFIRGVAAAFAAEDEAGFRSLLKDAREARA